MWTWRVDELGSVLLDDLLVRHLADLLQGDSLGIAATEDEDALGMALHQNDAQLADGLEDVRFAVEGTVDADVGTGEIGILSLMVHRRVGDEEEAPLGFFGPQLVEDALHW